MDVEVELKEKEKARRAKTNRRKDWLPITVGLAASLMGLFLLLPFMGLLWRTGSVGVTAAVAEPSLFMAVWLSFGTTAVSVLLTFAFGTPLAFVLARRQFPLKRLLTLFVELPIVMPPVVAGLALLSAFGRRGLLGGLLASVGVTVPFTITAVVLAQLFVSAPFYIRAAQSHFASLPRVYEDAAAVDGATSWQSFRYVILPQSYRAMMSGLLLSWARALGEFGATILFAGNLQGSTQTMPLLVYGALERDLGVTFTTALILLGLAMLLFGLTRWLAGLENEEGWG